MAVSPPEKYRSREFIGIRVYTVRRIPGITINVRTCDVSSHHSWRLNKHEEEESTTCSPVGVELNITFSNFWLENSQV
jgi:hypothetical protein